MRSLYLSLVGLLALSCAAPAPACDPAASLVVGHLAYSSVRTRVLLVPQTTVVEHYAAPAVRTRVVQRVVEEEVADPCPTPVAPAARLAPMAYADPGSDPLTDFLLEQRAAPAYGCNYSRSRSFYGSTGFGGRAFVHEGFINRGLAPHVVQQSRTVTRTRTILVP